MSRKRRREPEPEEVQAEEQAEQANKEQEMWDAFREEHYEVVEQMPLTIHRQYTLMRELDEQSAEHMKELLPSLRTYVSLRQAITPENQTPASRSRQVLSRIASLSEELMKAAEEKVNLAQSVHDYVDRHIRILDQAIKEQEAMISVGGVREGTHVALPDLVVPRLLRAREQGSSPIEENAGTVIGFGAYENSKKPGRKGKKKATTNVSTPVAGKRTASGIMITLPALSSPKDVDGPYCYCRKPSYGAMVACDGRNCEIEWFHLPCVNLTEMPSTRKWFCNECRSSTAKGSRR